MSHTKVGDWADLGRCAWVEKGDTVRVRGQVWVTAVSCMIVERAEVLVTENNLSKILEARTQGDRFAATAAIAAERMERMNEAMGTIYRNNTHETPTHLTPELLDNIRMLCDRWAQEPESSPAKSFSAMIEALLLRGDEAKANAVERMNERNAAEVREQKLLGDLKRAEARVEATEWSVRTLAEEAHHQARRAEGLDEVIRYFGACLDNAAHKYRDIPVSEYIGAWDDARDPKRIAAALASQPSTRAEKKLGVFLSAAESDEHDKTNARLLAEAIVEEEEDASQPTEGRCGECDPSFGCFDGSAACQKRPRGER